MILQINILLKIIKKNYKWLILFLAIVVLDFIFITVRPEQIKINEQDFWPIIGYPVLNNGFISILLYIYQFVFLMYVVYTFLKDDFEYSFENIILRINSKTWITYKTVVSFLFIIAFKIFQIFVAYIYFSDKINYNFEHFFSSILLSLLISSFVIFNLNFSKKINFILLIIEFLIFIAFFVHFNSIVLALVLIVINLYNITFFKFKKTILLNSQ